MRDAKFDLPHLIQCVKLGAVVARGILARDLGPENDAQDARPTPHRLFVQPHQS